MNWFLDEYTVAAQNCCLDQVADSERESADNAGGDEMSSSEEYKPSKGTPAKTKGKRKAQGGATACIGSSSGGKVMSKGTGKAGDDRRDRGKRSKIVEDLSLEEVIIGISLKLNIQKGVFEELDWPGAQ